MVMFAHCCWLLLVPLRQCFNVDNMKKQTPKITDYTVFSNKMLKWNFFGHGYLVIYSITRRNKYFHDTSNSNKQNDRKRGKLYALSILLTLIVLSGDVQLNPGPSADFSPEQTSTSGLTEAWRSVSLCGAAAFSGAADLLELAVPHVEIDQRSLCPPVYPVFHPDGSELSGECEQPYFHKQPKLPERMISAANGTLKTQCKQGIRSARK